MPNVTPTNPQDVTGRAAERAAKENAKALADRKDEIAISRQIEAESLANDIFDPAKPEAPLLLDEIEEVGVQLRNEDETVVIRTIADIEDMTFGVGNNYTFKAGVKYKVHKDLAAHLVRLGYVWAPGQ